MGDRYGWTGRERDTDTGWEYHRERYYDPKGGRWVGEDPSAFTGGDLNLSRYAGNNAVNLTDPTGLRAGPIPASAGGLTFQMIKMPKKDLHGIMEWLVRWKAPVGKSGAIIQHIIMDEYDLEYESYTKTSFGAVKVYRRSVKKTEYFERWEVRNGKVFAPRLKGGKVVLVPSDRDRFAIAGPEGAARDWKPNAGMGTPPLPRTGHKTIVGSSKFIENYRTDPRDKWVFNIPEAGGLPATKTPPKGWFEPGAVRREMTIAYDNWTGCRFRFVPHPTMKGTNWVLALDDVNDKGRLLLEFNLRDVAPREK